MRKVTGSEKAESIPRELRNNGSREHLQKLFHCRGKKAAAAIAPERTALVMTMSRTNCGSSPAVIPRAPSPNVELALIV